MNLSRVRPFSTTAVLVIQILVGTANFVVGLLLISFYALIVPTTNAESTTATSLSAFSVILRSIAFFSFFLGILSFATSIVAVGNQTPQLTPATNFALQPIPSWYASPTPVETDQYVTEMRQTVVAQTREWTELYCLRCGRDLEEQANYCDACGAPAKAGLRPHIGDVD